MPRDATRTFLPTRSAPRRAGALSEHERSVVEPSRSRACADHGKVKLVIFFEEGLDAPILILNIYQKLSHQLQAMDFAWRV
ncbi:MAG: hypothetical protein DWQ31_09215 [Planctomycetota bacterium]|nr:MAG: hypothetical protein DWQ31_09215 [Planctomycetota bacterium]REJ91369.1 MAG: hypothetical protein DWQ35_14550 [Planctomycetota bacterium]REK18511.1 MAG: hypothetical protein DWQ42_20135 [Planctomycetota bacterium]REK39429.1 MAG: hypothetical protein DWQ46_19370 [Planctomycetota bacterium]